MKSIFVEKTFEYNGSQLSHLYAYLNYKILGDSVVSWVGPCNVLNEYMVDAEDLISESAIRGSNMVHFIVQKFDIDFYAGVSLQRLISSLAKDLIEESSEKNKERKILKRDGDDLYFETRKLSISIAKKFQNSVMIHFAVNVSNEGTPVPTAALEEFSLDPHQFARQLMMRISDEAESIRDATHKVRE